MAGTGRQGVSLIPIVEFCTCGVGGEGATWQQNTMPMFKGAPYNGLLCTRTVAHLNVRAQLERIIFILVRNIDQESSCEIVQDVVPNDHWLAGHTCNGAELSSVR
jgi:hypothetical protein